MVTAASPDMSPDTRAAAALDLVGRDPSLALAEADGAVEAALTWQNVEAASMAHRAAGLALRELGDLHSAEQRLRAAVEVADRGSAERAAAEARMSLAFVLLDRGRLQAALTQADRAAATLSGLPSLRLTCQRALILQRTGRLEAALAVYDSVLPSLRKAGDSLWEARLHNNRGLLHAHRGSVAAAETDFVHARRIYDLLGMAFLVAESEFNLGNVAALRGDAPAALASYDRAESAPVLQDKPVLLLNRCQVLLSVGLFDEARRTAQRAVDGLRARDQQADLAEAHLLLAEAAAACGDPAAATSEANAAHLAFTRQGRPGWASLARLVALRAAAATGTAPQELVQLALSCAQDLAAAGWYTAAVDAELIAAAAALNNGDVAAARKILSSVGRARRSVPLEVRVRAWHTRALLRKASDDRRGAFASLRAGLALVERQQAVLGVTEMRVHVSTFGTELAALGLELALTAGDARRVLLWAERWRARALRLRPVTPPDDPELSAALTELRRITAQSTRDRLAGTHAPTSAELVAAEDRVLRASRTARSQLRRPEDPPPTPARLVAALGDAALVEFIHRDGELLAVTLRRGRCRLRRIAPLAAVAGHIDTAVAALRTLALSFGSDRGRQAVRIAAEAAGADLDSLLFGPLRDDIGGRPLVIVPTGVLHRVPWGLLPGLALRPVVVAPSAAAWRRAVRIPVSPHGRVTFAAGPDLPAAHSEVAELGRRHPTATTFLDGRATVSAVLAGLDGASLAHIAAHGRLRADNPLLSALELADGPLTVYDLERLARAPNTVVLPACQSGITAVRAGDELLGLVSALLALGTRTRTVIAPVVPVSDSVTKPLMLDLHDRLQRGHSTVEALAAVRSGVDRRDGDAVLTAASFVCYGA